MGGLRHLLRQGTAGLHRAVEEAVGLPDSVTSREDYTDLLTRLHRFHVAMEDRLARPRWSSAWSEVGIRLDEHERSPLLARDLGRLGAPVTSQTTRDLPAPALPDPVRFGAALGCLYVLEGSSLGGRVLAPAVRRTLGDVPTGFLDGDGRQHPQPWRSVQEALRRYEAAHGDPDDVLTGARESFVGFGRYVAGDRFVAAAAT